MVLRPGPYICGERDWGGFPAWLSTVPGLIVRTYNEPYLNYSTRYLERLAADLQHLQVTKGGPLLMVQVENEVSNISQSFESRTKDIQCATHCSSSNAAAEQLLVRFSHTADQKTG